MPISQSMNIQDAKTAVDKKWNRLTEIATIGGDGRHEQERGHPKRHKKREGQFTLQR